MRHSCGDLIDVNVSLSRWPLRRLPGDEPAELVAKLRAHRVVQAWAGSFDGLLHRDVAAVNARLAQACRDHGDGLLVPFGTVNPTLPDWEEDLRRCRVEHAMPGIRLHPNYHGYGLDDPRFARLLHLAHERDLVVQIALTMEDERMQHPLLRVPHVDPAPLPDLLRQIPGLRVMLLNAFRSQNPDRAADLAARAPVSFDIAMLDGMGCVEELLKRVPLERIMLGSHFPLFSWEAAVGKIVESAPGGLATAALCRDNARRLLRQAG